MKKVSISTVLSTRSMLACRMAVAIGLALVAVLPGEGLAQDLKAPAAEMWEGTGEFQGATVGYWTVVVMQIPTPAADPCQWWVSGFWGPAPGVFAGLLDGSLTAPTPNDVRMAYGMAYDPALNPIGKWCGEFPPEAINGWASGKWKAWQSGKQSGTWTGSRQ